MENIIDGLYIGKDEDYLRIKGKPGWSILRACKDGPGSHRELAGYTGRAAPKDKNYYFIDKGNTRALNLVDSPNPEYIWSKVIDPGIDFIKSKIQSGEKVLVACNRGKSRSPTITMLFLRSIGELPDGFARAEKIFKTLYQPYDPGDGMLAFAKAHWNQWKG